MTELEKFYSWIQECAKKKMYLDVDSNGFTSKEAQEMMLLYNYHFKYSSGCSPCFFEMINYFMLLLPSEVKNEQKINGDSGLRFGNDQELDTVNDSQGEVEIVDNKPSKKQNKKRK